MSQAKNLIHGILKSSKKFDLVSGERVAGQEIEQPGEVHLSQEIKFIEDPVYTYTAEDELEELQEQIDLVRYQIQEDPHNAQLQPLLDHLLSVQQNGIGKIDGDDSQQTYQSMQFDPFLRFQPPPRVYSPNSPRGYLYADEFDAIRDEQDGKEEGYLQNEQYGKEDGFLQNEQNDDDKNTETNKDDKKQV
ncbi:MAG: hypothetical protein EZS28_042158 [Streblomastix strix]|uniref:Uncharacterized protein n=1 Tax=Streblomastix strix TaxID=222440 RepID=A0A5J4TVL5_9EUKA|nr:MAG: hypothetical protein EZS28_042158 [Streblomastix strix]